MPAIGTRSASSYSRWQSSGTGALGDLIGMATRNPEATAPLLLVPQVTLDWLLVGLQPVERFPQWIQPFVRDQLLSQFLNALRAFAGDTPAALRSHGRSSGRRWPGSPAE